MSYRDPVCRDKRSSHNLYSYACAYITIHSSHVKRSRVIYLSYYNIFSGLTNCGEASFSLLAIYIYIFVSPSLQISSS